MARGRVQREIPYKRNRLPRRFNQGRKKRDDYGGMSFEDRLAVDGFGALYDPARHTGDVNYRGGGGGR